MTKKLKVAALGVASVSIALIFVVLFFSYQLLKVPVGEDATEMLFDVNPGSSLTQITNDLEARGLIRNSKSLQLYAKFKNYATKIKVGEYALNKAMTPDDIMSVLVAGKSVARPVTVVEGANLFDVAEVFEKNNVGTREEFFKLVYDKAFIKALLDEDLTSLEGYLFPETYKVTKFEGTKAVLTQMVNRFLTVWKEVEPVGRRLNWSRHRLVTFASIVEKETGASSERPVISSVFHNRLQKGMRLQTDPTVLYGMALKQGKMPDNITKNDLLTPTPYNSYTNADLPPTPISNPGREAMLAAAMPKATNYLYFVSRNDGTTVFSETLEQHNKAVQEFQMNPKARENKSWRDLNPPKQ